MQDAERNGLSERASACARGWVYVGDVLSALTATLISESTLTANAQLSVTDKHGAIKLINVQKCNCGQRNKSNTCLYRCSFVTCVFAPFGFANASLAGPSQYCNVFE